MTQAKTMSSHELVDEEILGRLSKQIEMHKWSTTYLFTGNELTRKRELAIAFAKALNCLNVSSLPATQKAGPSFGGRGSVSSKAEAISESGIVRHKTRRDSPTKRFGTDSANALWRTSSAFPPNIVGRIRPSAERPPRNDVRSCECASCKKIQSGTHPDVKWYGIDEERNTIKISEVRDFKGWLNLKPYEARVKVFIFDQAEQLTAEAQNALLKSIEEPPPGNIIIFLVPNAKSLFDTIASRSVEIKIPPFPSEAIKKILVREGVPKEEAEFLARMSHGELGLAQQAHQEGWFKKKNQWIDALWKDSTSFLEQFHGSPREEVSKVLGFLIEWVRDLLVFQASGSAGQLIHLDRLPLIQSVISNHDFESALELFETLSQLKKSLDDYANQKLVLTETEVLLEHFLRA